MTAKSSQPLFEDHGHTVGGPLILATPSAFSSVQLLAECQGEFYVEVSGDNASAVAQANAPTLSVATVNHKRARVSCENRPQADFIALRVNENTGCSGKVISTAETKQRFTDAGDLDLNGGKARTQIDGLNIYAGTWLVRGVEIQDGRATAIMLVEETLGADLHGVSTDESAEDFANAYADLENSVAEYKAEIESLKKQLAEAAPSPAKKAPAKKAAPRKAAPKKAPPKKR